VTAKVAVICFPGSNCEHDVVRAISALGGDAQIVWHAGSGRGAGGLDDCDAVVLPGGFAHGDYLRTGALARFSPIMAAVEEFAREGGPVLGICNGFQILSESGLLPGALRPNMGLRFICTTLPCTVAQNTSVLTAGIAVGTKLQLPINHGEGNFTCDAATLASIEDSGQVVLRYDTNPNGSMGSIAGICNAKGNVVGLMPHPERASSDVTGCSDGSVLLEAFLGSALVAS